MVITADEQMASLEKVGHLVAEVLRDMQRHARIGMSTAELDEYGGQLLNRAGARSAPQLVYQFPGYTCISVNSAAAHGIPDSTLLKPGDLVNIDVSAELEGYFADTGGSFVMPGAESSADYRLKIRLCEAARHARDCGVAYAQAGRRLNELGRCIHNSIQAAGFRNVRNLCGHGVGAALHEEPTVRNYFDQRDTGILQAGQVITIEPFLSTNVSQVREAADGWTLIGRPSSLFAQHEHTLVITRGAPIILTQ